MCLMCMHVSLSLCKLACVVGKLAALVPRRSIAGVKRRP